LGVKKALEAFADLQCTHLRYQLRYQLHYALPQRQFKLSLNLASGKGVDA
jgi:hypothetical protein